MAQPPLCKLSHLTLCRSWVALLQVCCYTSLFGVRKCACACACARGRMRAGAGTRAACLVSLLPSLLFPRCVQSAGDAPREGMFKAQRRNTGQHLLLRP